MKKSYWELLRDPRWQKRRLEVMERAGWHCEECDGESVTFNVHHRIYRKGANPWEYADHELACLCEPCHKTVTNITERLKEALAFLDCAQLEVVAGYARGLRLQERVGEREELSREPGFLLSAEDWWGMGDAFGVRYPHIEDACNGDTSEHTAAIDLLAARREMSNG